MIRMLSRSCRPVVAFVVCSLVPAGVYAQSAPGTSPTVPSAVPQVVDTIHACVGLVMGLVTAGIHGMAPPCSSANRGADGT